jgi:uncharacterized coiled-coil DUF342 family protein
MGPQQVAINLDAINREAFFAETLLERNKQLMAAVGEIQQLRQALQAAREEIEALKGEASDAV